MAIILPAGKGRFSQKITPENLEPMVHKNAIKPRAIAASLEMPKSGKVKSKIASLVPRPLMVTGMTFMMPISALQATIGPKPMPMFNEMASRYRTSDLNIPMMMEIPKMRKNIFKLKSNQNFVMSVSRFRPTCWSFLLAKRLKSFIKPSQVFLPNTKTKHTIKNVPPKKPVKR